MPKAGESFGNYARAKTEQFRSAVGGAPVAHADSDGRPSTAMLPVMPQAPGLKDRIWWGAATRDTAVWTAQQGMHLMSSTMSSTLMTEDTGLPFDELQAEQIRMHRDAWRQAGWAGEPRVSVTRSVMPIISDFEGMRSRFGRSYTGEPDVIAQELARDAAVQSTDTLLLTVPNQLGVEYNAHLLDTVARHVAPALGWQSWRERAREGQAALAR